MVDEDPPEAPAPTNFMSLKALLQGHGNANVTDIATARRPPKQRGRARQSAALPVPPTALDLGREIPPQINPDVPMMIAGLKRGYRDILAGIAEFGYNIAELKIRGVTTSSKTCVCITARWRPR